MNDEALQALRADERLSAVDWPCLQEIEAPSVEAGDCLLVCAGFEDQAVEALRRTCNSGTDDFSLGIIKYLPPYSQNKLGEIIGISRTPDLNVQEFVYDRENPAGIGEELKSFAQGFNRVFIDVSSMSRLLIVQTLVALWAPENRPVTVIYSEASEYPPSREQFNQDYDVAGSGLPLSYLSSGIFEIVTTPELSSVSMLGEALRLIAFPSFDPTQLRNLLQELQPAYTDIIHGIPPDQENRWRKEAIRKLNRQEMDSLRGNKDHEACTLDYRLTLRVLLDIYEKRSMYDRLAIAPTGSKMQAIAVGLFRAALYDVQIVYPTPQTFSAPDQYTLGVRRLYEVALPSWS